MLRFLRGATRRTKTIWWILIFVTVVTFVGGFVFLLGSGLSAGSRARTSGDVGVVGGEPITRTEWQTALQDQRENYKRQYGVEPTERDAAVVELQAWRGLVTQKLLAREARGLGITVSDREVVLGLETSPPPALANSPVFQTDGKFDPAKYQQAMRDPKNNWAPFEAIIRRQMPVRKLQERMLASIKLSEPELREAFRDRQDRADATVAQVPAASDSQIPPPSDADLERTYQKYRARFASGARTQLEALVVPKRVGEEEVRAAREMAQGLVNRARQGEDFAALTRDYSEGPGADKGGVIDREFRPADFGPQLGPKIMATPVGGVTDPFLDGTRFIVLKILEKKTDPSGLPSLKLAQLVVKVRPNEETLRAQYDELKKLRERAARIGLGKAAAERGIATMRTEYYDLNGAPQALYGVPAASDWGLTAKAGAVSPLFAGIDEFAIVQVAEQHAAGIPARQEIAEPIRQLAAIEARVDRSKRTADGIAEALARGASLEKAATAAGITPMNIQGTTRSQPDPRIAGIPELTGALFAAAPGKTVGPLRGPGGWYFARLDRLAPADTTAFGQLKGQISTEVLQRRQQSFFTGYIAGLRARAKVEDLRSETESY
jgi:parvulin-like peptidyl-prolyl isomerase